ncbi:uncharacterized protein LOC124259339 [Haliotis rubra]|uniref:uncharacterized protein LOC124259339 n=1 Tax=Haliotis rubra TaxID=36100 RepID=UPI001EE61970|nr:uncharacterized protein LOC124259339 [Haliotis rubra]
MRNFGHLLQLNKMEGHHRVSMNSTYSWFSFKIYGYADPVLRLHIKCGEDISHVMVAVNKRQGSLKHLLLLEAGNNLEQSVLALDTVQVFGLKIDTGQSSSRYPFATSYTVETSHDVAFPSTKVTQEVDLSCGTWSSTTDHITHLLGDTQDDLEMEVEHKPPLTYSLKPTGPSDSEAGLCVVFCERSQKEYVVMSSTPISAGIPLLPVCQSRNNYRVKVMGLKGSRVISTEHWRVVGGAYTPSGGSDIITIKTCNTKEDLQRLLCKAKTFCSKNLQNPSKYNVKKFYRNKPETYFDDIMANTDGVMEKYLKDNNGDPYCPINNKICGLFFSGSKHKKKIPNFSFFGNKRLFIPVEEMFTSDTRMYFSDFYCHKETHYVTAVLTKRGSAEDTFCEERLIELDLQSNPFFTTRDDPFLGKTFTMTSVSKFHVEFLYTEDVDISALMDKYGKDKVFKRVHIRGRGRSKKEGIPKKLDCPDCCFDSVSEHEDLTPGWF